MKRAYVCNLNKQILARMGVFAVRLKEADGLNDTHFHYSHVRLFERQYLRVAERQPFLQIYDLYHLFFMVKKRAMSGRI
jgi:hypothetical protein